MSSRSHLLSTSSLGTLSCHLTPAMYLNILLSVVLIMSRNPTVKGHVSEPYNRTGLMHASYTLARCLKGTPRLTKRLDISFHFNQDAEILPLTATSTPPSHSSSSPRYLKVSTSSSLPSSNSMLLSSLLFQIKNLKSVFGGRHRKTYFYIFFGIIKSIRKIKISCSITNRT